MKSIHQAIKQAISEVRMRELASSDEAAADHVWTAVQQAMKHEGMILFDRPVNVSMLNRQIEETCKFEQALAEVAQNLNEAIGNIDSATSRRDAGQGLNALVDVARKTIKEIEQTNPNWPLHKSSPQSDEDRLWEHHLLRGTVPDAHQSSLG